MRYRNWITFLTILCFYSLFSQENVLKHQVLKGETIFSISKQYNVTTKAIFELNPDSEKGIKANSILLIPQSKNSNSSSNIENTLITNTKLHTVQENETLYGISKQYGISINDLYKCNIELKNSALKKGQFVNIPIKEIDKQNPIVESQPISKETKEEVSPIENNDLSEDTLLRVVLPKETKYGIAKQYGITVEELERQNPAIINTLPVGYKLTIKQNQKIEKLTSISEKTQVVNQEINEDKTQLIERIIETAHENIGTRYRSGGTTKSGFDCSGLVFSTFEKFNIILPRSSVEQSTYGERIDITEAKRGDLIFFKTGRRNEINHVGMVVDVQDGAIKFIHSSTHQGVIVSSTDESYYSKNLVQVNRVL